jgi:hypothetical protein
LGLVLFESLFAFLKLVTELLELGVALLELGLELLESASSFTRKTTVVWLFCCEGFIDRES